MRPQPRTRPGINVRIVEISSTEKMAALTQIAAFQKTKIDYSIVFIGF
jgi:hypothetical protein